METLLRLHEMTTKDKPAIMGGLNENQMDNCRFCGIRNGYVF